MSRWRLTGFIASAAALVVGGVVLLQFLWGGDGALHGFQDTLKVAALTTARSPALGEPSTTATAGNEQPSAAEAAEATPPASTPEPAAAATSPDQLERTNWWGNVQENIRNAEYNITCQEKCVIEGEPDLLDAECRYGLRRHDAAFRAVTCHRTPRRR